MNFDYELQTLETPELTLEYFAVPWDTELMSIPTAQIKRMVVRDSAGAGRAFANFGQWKADQRIAFCTAKIPHRSIPESLLLQAHGYRFIELNYQPHIQLQGPTTGHDGFEFLPAEASDQAELCELASSIFKYTRFHLDPLLPPGTGDRRYESWMTNAFTNPRQQIVKCGSAGNIQAFFVQERPAPDHIFWSLVGLAPGLQGRGIARRIWRAALDWLKQQGVKQVSTSISSLNTPVLNLYVALGFRFPEPQITLHWHRDSGASE